MTPADPSQNASPVQPDVSVAEVAPQNSGAIAQGTDVAVAERREEVSNPTLGESSASALDISDSVDPQIDAEEASLSDTDFTPTAPDKSGGFFRQILNVIQNRRSQVAEAQIQGLAYAESLTDTNDTDAADDSTDIEAPLTEAVPSALEEAAEGVAEVEEAAGNNEEAIADSLEVSIASPETSAPEIAVPEAALLEDSETEAASFEATETEAPKSEITESEITEAEVTESEVTEAEINPTDTADVSEDITNATTEDITTEDVIEEDVIETEENPTPIDLTETAAEEQELSSAPEKAKPTQGSFLARHRLLVGATAGATILGAGVASYLVQQRVGGPAPEDVLSLVPSNAIAAVQITDDRSQWESLRRLGTPALQRGVGQWLALGRDRINNLGYGDWQKLQSQIAGDVALALIPTDASTTAAPIPGLPSAAPPDLLLVVPVKNPGAIQREIANLEPPEGFENKTFSHRGIEIFEIQANLAQRHAVALLGSFWVMAADTATVEGAIDGFLDRQSVLQLQDLRRSRSQLMASESGDAFMELYLNTPAATEAAMAAGRLLPLPKDVEGLSARFDLSGNGFEVSSLTWQPPRDRGLGLLSDAPQTTEPVELTQLFGDRFPASTSLLLSGSSFRDAWASYGRRGTSSLFSADALREQVRAVTTMDLDKEWLSWMDGPYSVGILPIPSRANSRFQTGLTVMVQTTNRRTAERSLQKLDSLMVNKYGMRLNTGKLAGQPVVNWSSPEGEPVVTHGWLENNVAFLIVGAPGANSLLPAPRATLAGSPLFREGMPRQEAEAQRSTGEMFVDVDRFSKTNLISLLPLPTGTQPLVGALKSFGAERTIVDEALTRYDLSFQFLRSFEAPATELPSTQSSESEVEQSEVESSEVGQPTEEAESELPTEEAVTDEPLTDEPLTELESAPVAEPEADLDEVLQEDEELPEDNVPEAEELEAEELEEQPQVEQSQAERSAAARSEDPLGPEFPKNAYDRLNFGPNLPRPSENPWSEGFAGEERTPIGGEAEADPQSFAIPEAEPEVEQEVEPAPELEVEPAVEATEIEADANLEADAVSQTVPDYLKPLIPSGPPLPTSSDRQAFGPQKN